MKMILVLTFWIGIWSLVLYFNWRSLRERKKVRKMIKDQIEIEKEKEKIKQRFLNSIKKEP